ncbi:MAG: helix-turn-helix domain-containing protein [Gammaproteobacteria bacterium]
MRNTMKNAILDTVNDLHKQGVVDDLTLREMEALCLPKLKAYSPTAIKRIRRKLRLSQAALAKFLNTSVSTIQKWETGAKKPSAIAVKLLNIADDKGIEGLI